MKSPMAMKDLIPVEKLNGFGAINRITELGIIKKFVLSGGDDVFEEAVRRDLLKILDMARKWALVEKENGKVTSIVTSKAAVDRDRYKALLQTLVEAIDFEGEGSHYDAFISDCVSDARVALKGGDDD